MPLILLNIVPLAARLLAQGEDPIKELSIDPLNAFWITLLIVIVVAILILINALGTPWQVEEYGLEQAHGESGHGDDH
jgi:hypothetical protein